MCDIINLHLGGFKMTLEYAKQEMIRRYKFLYENAYFVLAPYMYEQSEEDYKKQVEENLKKYKDPILKKARIYLNINTLDNINSLFEEFLLFDKVMEESTLYQMIESNRNNKEYLDKVKKGLELVEKSNEDKEYDMFKLKLDVLKIFVRVYDYIKEQSGDLKNKDRKLHIIDEYCRIARYQNNGKIYTSGRNLDLHDVSSVVVDLNKREPFRDKKDIGIKNNDFIIIIANAPHYEDNCSIFTENEKQKIYLEYHDELPCDLEIACELEEEYVQTMIETRLYRPENTMSCGENFIVKEDEIFINSKDKLYRYYQLCPHCGYIVNIPKEILSNGIKLRIEYRCSEDNMLFRKMFLYSELFSLDKKSTDGQKKVLKK